MHQLPARHPARHRLVQHVPGLGLRSHRRAHARSTRSRRSRPTSPAARRARHHLPGRAGQQLCRRGPTTATSYWPAEYLIDANGTVRHIKFGEGDYNVTENLIRQLLSRPNPASPPAGQRRARHHTAGRPDPRNLPRGREGGSTTAVPDPTTRATPPSTIPPTCPTTRSPSGPCGPCDDQGATADDDDRHIELNYHAQNVYLVVGGEGTVTVAQGRQDPRHPDQRPPDIAPDRPDDTGAPRPTRSAPVAKDCRHTPSPTADVYECNVSICRNRALRSPLPLHRRMRQERRVTRKMRRIPYAVVAQPYSYPIRRPKISLHRPNVSPRRKLDDRTSGPTRSVN